MASPLISAGIGAAVGIGQSIYGGVKSGQANKKMSDLESNRPIYSRPDEIKQYLEMAKTNTNSNMPGQTQMEQNNQQSTQSSISKLEETGQLDAGAIQKLYQSEVGAHNNLAMQQAQYYQSNQDRLGQAFQKSAQYADQEFEYNVNAPWQRQYNKAIGQYESGQQTLNSGLNSVAGAAMSGASMFGGSGGVSSASAQSSSPWTSMANNPLSSQASQIGNFASTPNFQ
jgi:hypothetical protein